jgi:hypothetical protein
VYQIHLAQTDTGAGDGRRRDPVLTTAGIISRIVIEPTTIRGERGQRYRVHFEGAVLIDDTWNPELEACRALVVRGVSGRLEVWRADRASPAMIITDIAGVSGRTVKENEKMGPRSAPWAPLPEDLGADAVSRDPVFAPAAEKVLDGVTRP